MTGKKDEDRLPIFMAKVTLAHPGADLTLRQMSWLRRFGRPIERPAAAIHDPLIRVPDLPALLQQAAVERRLAGHPVLLETIIENFSDLDRCWIYRGKARSAGYGTGTRANGQRTNASRLIFELLKGAIFANYMLLERLEVDHICHIAALCNAQRNGCPHRACVNPLHLAASTRQENVQRTRLDDCGRCGLALSGDNLYLSPADANGRRHRACRACRAAADARHKAKNGPRVPAPKDRTTCPAGHAYDRVWGGYRCCSSCANDHAARYRAKKNTQRQAEDKE
ncbi:hypothetical protein ACX801_07085 [Arthrobacter bambusae]